MNFARQLADQFQKIESVHDVPNFRLIDKLFEILKWKDIPHKTLGRALGKAHLRLSSFEQVDLMEKEGTIEELARFLNLLYEYSLATFGHDDFFVEACAQLHIEF